MFVKGHTILVTILLNDLNGVECVMATLSAENVDPSGPLAVSDVIKCVVMFYKRGTSGNNFIRKEKLGAVLDMNYKTLRRIPRSRGGGYLVTWEISRSPDMSIF